MIWIVAAALALLLIELFLRRRPWAIALSAMIAAIGIIVWIFSDSQSRQQRDAVSAVTVNVSADGRTCVDSALPVAAVISNGSGNTVSRLSFDLIGRQQGKSTIAYRGYLRHEQIIAPGATITRCYPLLYHGFAHPRPQIIDATKYEWSAHVSLVSFGEPPAE